MSYDYEIPTRRKKKKPTFESEKKRLRQKQETIHSNPKKHYTEINIPDSGKIGKNFTVKFTQKIQKIQINITNDFVWKRKDRYNPKAGYEVSANLFLFKEEKDSKKITIKLENIELVAGIEKNLLEKGEYLVEVTATGNEAHEETTARKLITIK